MTVYILLDSDNRFIGVFSTEEKAQVERERLEQFSRTRFRSNEKFIVLEEEVQ